MIARFLSFVAALGLLAPARAMGDTGDPYGSDAYHPIPTEFAGPVDQVVVACSYASTTLTWSPSDAESAASGILLPIAAGTTEADLAALNPAAINELDLYTRPWLWDRTCGQSLDAASGCASDEDTPADRSSPDPDGCGFGDDDPSDRVTGPRVTGDGGDVETLGDYRYDLFWPESGAQGAMILQSLGSTVPAAVEEAMQAWVAQGGGFAWFASTMDLSLGLEPTPHPDRPPPRRPSPPAPGFRLGGR